MSFRVWACGGTVRRCPVFETLQEATAMANEIARKEKIIVCIEECKAKPTHIYKEE